MNEQNENNSNENRHQQKRKSSFKLIKFIVLIAVLVVIGIWAFFWVSFRIAHVSSEDAQVAAHIVTVSSRLPGRITKFTYIIGDHLQKGEFVAKLYDKPDRVKLAKLKTHAKTIENKLAAQKAHLKVIQTRLAGGIEQTKELLEKDKAGVEVAKANMIKAKKLANRMETLYKSDSVTEQKRDNARYTYRAAKASYKKAQQDVEFDKQAMKNAQNGMLLNPQAELPDPKVLGKQIKITESSLEEAQKSIKHQQVKVDDMVIKSPLTGVIDKTFINAGDYVAPGQPILMMHDPKRVWILAKIKETQITDLRVGQHVDINVDAHENEKYSGHIKVIGSAATNQFALLPNPNPSGNFTKIAQRIPVRIAIDKGPKKKLSPGMMVEVHINITNK